HTSTQPTDLSRMRAAASETFCVGFTCQGGVGLSLETLSILRLRARSMRFAMIPVRRLESTANSFKDSTHLAGRREAVLGGAIFEGGRGTGNGAGAIRLKSRARSKRLA